MLLSGLSIEGNRLRATFLERSVLGKVTRLGSEDLEFDASAPEAERAAALGEVLAKWKTERKIEGAIVGLEPGLFSVSTMELPVSSRKDILSALGFELERHLPLPPEEYSYDFVVMEARAGVSKVLVLAVRKDRLKWILQGFELAGLRLLGLRCSAFEALNEFLATQNAHNTVFIYKGGDSLCLFGIRGAVAEQTRVLLKGSSAAADVKELFTQFTGGSYSVVQGEAPAFQSLKPFDLTMDVPELLASSHWRKRRYSMELVPSTEASANQEWLKRATLALAAGCAALYLMTALLGLTRDYLALREVRARLSEITSGSENVLEIKKELDSLEENKRFLRQFQATKGARTGALRQLSISLPEEAWLTGFNADEKGVIEIQGYAKRAAELVRPLEKSKLFRNVEFSSQVMVRDGRERFSLRMETAQ